MASNAQRLFEKISDLPHARMAEVEDFVDFVREREEIAALRKSVIAASEPAFARVWSNPEDDVYDAL